MSKILISARELDELIQTRAPVHIVDGSMCPGEDCRAKFFEAHIPGAVFFDQDFIRDASASHTLALLSTVAFGEHMRALGLPNDDSQIVVYDQYSLISAARVWFLLKYYGYRSVLFLDGGLPKWMEENRCVVAGEASSSLPSEPSDASPNPYTLSMHKKLIAKWKEVRTIVSEIQSGSSAWQLWDPRNPAKVHDSVIPGSTRIFYRDILEPNGCLKPVDEVAQILTAKGLNLSKPTIVTCNRGVVSSAAFMILEYIGKTDVKNFLGSWLSWKQHADAATNPRPT